MRLRIAAPLIVLALVTGACGHSANDVAAPAPTVAPTGVTVGLGKHKQFQALWGSTWSLRAGADGGYVSAHGIYYAPLRSPTEPTIEVVATLGPSSAGVATIHLMPDPPDSLDCLAEGQSANEFGTYYYVQELPEAITRVNPVYPDSARQAGVDGLVMVQAHVCACGEVMETRIVKSVPMLDAAATEAVRQWIFKPARTAGEPVAVWVGVPVKFSLH